MSANFSKRNKNSTTIDRAFTRFKIAGYELILSVMKELMQSAMEFALREHDERHQHHLEMGDGYGWALWHQGTLVAYNITSGSGELSGDAMGKLMDRTARTRDWYGVLLADMKPSHYFAVDYENDMLTATANMSKTAFQRFFKPA